MVISLPFSRRQTSNPPTCLHYSDIGACKILSDINVPTISALPLESPCKEGNGDNAKDEFVEIFSEILDSVEELVRVKQSGDGMDDLVEWISAVMRYNVPDGKQIRGRLVVGVYQQLHPNATAETVKLARILGWITEIASCLIADDIMDNGITRRGKPCWHIVDRKGNIAFNDTLLLEHIAYQLIRKYFGKLDIYREIVELTQDATFNTILGQALDIRVGRSRNYEKYTTPIYESIVTYKTAYYTIYLPFAYAMTLAGFSTNKMENQDTWERVREITLFIGKLFQVQDDYLDCFADEKVLGKHATDIQEGKCTWLFVTAAQQCDRDQLEMLRQHYGSERIEDVAVVKKLYESLDLHSIYLEQQNDLRNRVGEMLRKVGNKQIQYSLYAVLEKLNKRKFQLPAGL